MSYPYTYKLSRPKYIFSATDLNHSHTDKLRGLLTYKPFRDATITSPKCLFIFIEDDRDHANQLYLALRNGIARFPGCRQLVGINLERDNVEPLLISNNQDENLPDTFYKSIDQRLSTGNVPDFAFIIYSKQVQDSHDPYPSAKTALSKYGVPSQYVSWELLNSNQQFRYAITNVAISFFVKLGGIPWTVNVNNALPTLVLGIGKANIYDPHRRFKERFIGYATCILSNGLYLQTSFFPPSNDYGTFLENLQTGISEVLSNQIEQGLTFGRVAVHISQFESRDTIHVIEDTLKKFETEQKKPIVFELVRLVGDSDFTVIDPSHPSYASKEGTVVALSGRQSLLVTEGLTEKDVWRGRKPVTLEISREYVSDESASFKDAIEDAFHLSQVDWRGTNSISQPVSLKYAQLLTHQVAKMVNVQEDICDALRNHTQFNKVPWFI